LSRLLRQAGNFEPKPKTPRAPQYERSNKENWGKAIVMGMLERDGKVRAKVVPDRRKAALRDAILGNVDAGTILYTDEHPAYMAVENEYAHKIINHLEGYVKENVHTNGIENFWSLLKRQLNGLTFPLSRFTCSATWMSKHSDSTRARMTMAARSRMPNGLQKL
jgi:hypothetical protein